jgi:hypothetical protein
VKVLRNLFNSRSLRLGGGDQDAADLAEEEPDEDEDEDDDDERALRLRFRFLSGKSGDRDGPGDADCRCSVDRWGGTESSEGASSLAGEDWLRAGEQLDLETAASGERLRLTETTRRAGLLAVEGAEPETLRDREALLCTRGATDTKPAIATRGRDGPGWGDRERSDGGISNVTVRTMRSGEEIRALSVAAEDWSGERERRDRRESERCSMTRDS